jgi:hypothetical protein
VTVVYHLYGYDKTTGPLAAEHPVPPRLLPTVRTLIEPAPDDRDLVLPYELTTGAVLTLSEALGLTIDPAEYHYDFEASDASDSGVRPEITASAR